MQTNKKVLIVLPNNKLGGAEQIVLMFVKTLLKQDYFVEVFFLKYFDIDGWKNLQSDNLRSHYLSHKSEKNGFLKFIVKMIFKRNNNYALSFTSHIGCTSLVGLLNSLKVIKIQSLIARESTSIFKRYQGTKKKIYEVFYRIGYKGIKLLICQTEDMKLQLEQNLPYLKKRTLIKVIPNPIDLELIRGCENDEIKFQDEGNDLVKNIVTAGRLIPEKGFDILIDSFKILIDSYSENLNLYILGDGPDKDLLQSKINLLKLERKVFLEGYKSNVYPYFRKADLCVVSSRLEGFPNVLLQMMTQNEKVVSTLCAGGIEEIPGIAISKETTSSALANAIKECLLTDTSLNRVKFDDYIKRRDINEFTKIILNHVV